MTDSATTTDLQLAIRARDRSAINRLAARLLEQRTRLGEQWFSVAHVLIRTGEVALAVSAAERGVEECGGSAKAQFERAHVLSLVGRQGDAIALVSAIASDQLNPIQRDHFLGTCALEMGDFEIARAAFDRVLVAWPASGVTWLSLAALPPGDDSFLLKRLDDARSVIVGAPAESRARWHYAKGTVLDRLERTDEAFTEFAAGAEIVRTTRTYDPDTDRQEAVTLTNEFTSAAIRRVARQIRVDSSRPILVIGLPRSGTTLVEQMLTSHSQIAGGGEMAFASILRREIGGNSLSKLETFASAQGADHLTRLYLHLGDEQFGEGRRFVDKCLGNSRDLGMLASILPQARIIWLRRDPLDCAWSCFRTFFTQRIDWSWSLTDIANHFESEDILYSHWRRVLGDRLMLILYEELVANPAGQIGKILDHLGLDQEPAVQSMHQTRRPVSTASVAQVRQPVNRSSIGTAQRYLAYLKPFVKAYRTEA